MIRYKLICKKCDNSFDSWFFSSDEYEKLKKKNFLTCYNCNSLKVEKTLMSPSIITSKNNIETKNYEYKKIKKKIRDHQKFIKKNFDYVGDKFTYEARSLHYKNKKNSRGIYGTASKDELNELKEEGIEIETIPWINDNIN
jgi:hypothetical protein